MSHRPEKSPMEKRAEFYKLWEMHVKAGGAQTDEEWNNLAKDCGITPPARAPFVEPSFPEVMSSEPRR
jgi:hypothetical protein